MTPKQFAHDARGGGDHVTILGAGIAGLAAAWFAQKRGLATTILEAKSGAGGLCASFSVGEFRFDQGIHMLTTRTPAGAAFFAGTPTSSFAVDPRCVEGRRWFPHPIQSNTRNFSVSDRLRFITSFARRRRQRDSRDYEEWLRAAYGDVLAERFPMTYTRKYWRVDARELGTAWIGPRMATPSTWQVVRGAFRDESKRSYYLDTVRYPQSGGYGAFLAPYANALPVRLNAQVAAIDLERRIVTLADGEALPFERLINTLPLPEIARLAGPMPESVRAAAAELVATSVRLVSLTLDCDLPPRLTWFYIYDEDFPAARAYVPKFKSQDNSPRGQSSIQFEVYSSPRRPCVESDDVLIERCAAFLRIHGLATPNQIISANCRALPYANVVPLSGTESRRDVVRTFLAQRGVDSVGRFGAWEYFLSEGAMLSARRLFYRDDEQP